MRKESDYFEGRDPELIYIGKTLQDATRVESILTEAGIDYAVEPDEYHGGFIFRRTRIGAFFYVLPEARDQALALMKANGFDGRIAAVTE